MRITRALRQAFLDIAARSPERCVVVSAQRPVDEVAERILRLVEGSPRPRGAAAHAADLRRTPMAESQRQR